jgi:undecaprenyl-diphosphatase
MTAILAQQLDGENSRDVTSDRQWLRWTWWLIGSLLLFRLIYAAVVPLDLVPDEAYYWDWSRQLDWGYYSKPPMVAWLIALSTSLFGLTAFAVRLPAVLLGTLGLFWMYLLAARLYGRKAGFWAALLTAATPGNAALALLMTIDAPFLFCWCGALYCFWRFVESGHRSGGWLLAATLVTGLGLLSKQTMLGFFPLAVLFLAVSPRDRGRLFRPGFWVWIAGSLLFLTPFLLWNMQHDWITAQHTGGHFTTAAVGIGRRLARFGEFVASQFGGGTPVTMALYVAVLVLTAGGFRRIDRRARYLFCFSGLPMAGVLGLALVQRVQPNWPAGFVPAGLVLVCGWALGHVSGIRPLKAGSLGLRRAAVVGAACVLIAYLLPFGFGLQGSRIDPAARLRGWHELGQAADAAWRTLPQSQATFLVATTGRTEASELAFYLPAKPRVFVWNPTGQVLSQYDVWAKPKGMGGGAALIVTPPGESPPEALASAFDTIEPGGEVHIPIGNGRNHHYQLWRGLGFSRWPFGPQWASQACACEQSDAERQLCSSKQIDPRRCDGEGQGVRFGEPQSSTPQVLSDLVKQRPFRTGLGSGAFIKFAPDDLQPTSQDGDRTELGCVNNRTRTIVERPLILPRLVTVSTAVSRPSKRPPGRLISTLDLTAEKGPEETPIQHLERPQQRISQRKKPGGNRMSASLAKKSPRREHYDRTNVVCSMLSIRGPESRVLLPFFREGPIGRSPRANSLRWIR